MEVSPYTLPFTWEVKSATRQDITHLVELTKDGPVCSCENFNCRINPLRRLGKRGLACKHGRAALNAFADWALLTFHDKIEAIHAAHKDRVEQEGAIGARRVSDEEDAVEQRIEAAQEVAGGIPEASGDVQEGESYLQSLYE